MAESCSSRSDIRYQESEQTGTQVRPPDFDDDFDDDFDEVSTSESKVSFPRHRPNCLNDPGKFAFNAMYALQT